MQNIKKYKWLLFLMICFIAISFFQYLPQEQTWYLQEGAPQRTDMASDFLVSYSIEEQQAKQLMSGSIEDDQAKQQVSGSIEDHQKDLLMKPGIAERQVCTLPEETPAATLARTTQSEAVIGEQSQNRFHILRFLVEVYALLMIPAVVFHMALKRFSSHMIILWQNIKYIHLIDGKKAKRIPVIK